MNEKVILFIVVAIFIVGDMFARDILAGLMTLVTVALIGGVFIFGD